MGGVPAWQVRGRVSASVDVTAGMLAVQLQDLDLWQPHAVAQLPPFVPCQSLSSIQQSMRTTLSPSPPYHPSPPPASPSPYSPSLSIPLTLPQAAPHGVSSPPCVLRQSYAAVIMSSVSSAHMVEKALPHDRLLQQPVLKLPIPSILPPSPYSLFSRPLPHPLPHDPSLSPVPLFISGRQCSGWLSVTQGARDRDSVGGIGGARGEGDDGEIEEKRVKMESGASFGSGSGGAGAGAGAGADCGAGAGGEVGAGDGAAGGGEMGAIAQMEEVASGALLGEAGASMAGERGLVAAMPTAAQVAGSRSSGERAGMGGGGAGASGGPAGASEYHWAAFKHSIALI
ncbi:unnamed protein product [Closterium sp. NIES-64]|nr:unnamed protein product [Closterium sp. NIES-64]